MYYMIVSTAHHVHATSVLPGFEIIKAAIALMFDSFEQHNGEQWLVH
jgi:hypothetical protein